MLCAVWTSSFSTMEWVRCPRKLSFLMTTFSHWQVYSVVCFYVYLIAYILGSLVFEPYGHNVGGFMQHLSEPLATVCAKSTTSKGERAASIATEPTSCKPSFCMFYAALSPPGPACACTTHILCSTSCSSEAEGRYCHRSIECEERWNVSKCAVKKALRSPLSDPGVSLITPI